MAELLELPGRRSLADTVAANIRAEAARLGVEQRSLARALGMSQAAVSDRYRGKTAWTLNEVEAVARLLRTTASTLLYAPRDSNPEPADLVGAQVIDLTEYRVQRAGASAWATWTAAAR